MPLLKTEEILIQNDAVDKRVKIKIMVSASGQFYCHLDPEMLDAAKGVFDDVGSVQIRNDKLVVSEKTLDALMIKVKQTYRNFFEPEITKEHIIRYNLESHVMFAEDKDGNIFPNAGYPGAHWSHDDRMKYGGHSAQQPSEGGYSLTVGAQAMTKITYRYGDSSKVKYEYYYGEGGYHLGHTTPAEKLNSWCAFDLRYSKNEIPYTDEAAEFFYNLMMGMAKLSRMIQERTFHQEDLLQFIAGGHNLLIGSKPFKEDE